MSEGWLCPLDLVESLAGLELSFVSYGAYWQIAQYPAFSLEVGDLALEYGSPEAPAWINPRFYFNRELLTREEWFAKLLERIWERRAEVVASALRGD